jgi:hypothetical protein
VIVTFRSIPEEKTQRRPTAEISVSEGQELDDNCGQVSIVAGRIP